MAFDSLVDWPGKISQSLNILISWSSYAAGVDARTPWTVEIPQRHPMNTSPYARKTESIEAVIANVYRAACDDPAARDEADQLVRAAAAEAVAYYWPRPVRTFIPVLALRDVRASLHGVPTRSASAIRASVVS